MSQSEVVVITGASAGIGRALAREFGRHGARVGLIARDASDWKKLSGSAATAVADVADPVIFSQVVYHRLT
jgi:NAD(P)-dependent dehydrogenase (short-subunit alcohol dehydrogenase family)